jgi:hypothetical protein
MHAGPSSAADSRRGVAPQFSENRLPRSVPTPNPTTRVDRRSRTHARAGTARPRRPRPRWSGSVRPRPLAPLFETVAECGRRGGATATAPQSSRRGACKRREKGCQPYATRDRSSRTRTARRVVFQARRWTITLDRPSARRNCAARLDKKKGFILSERAMNHGSRGPNHSLRRRAPCIAMRRCPSHGNTLPSNAFHFTPA